DARLWVMVAQIGVDLLSCLVIARLAALLACASEDSAPNKSVYSIALWLAVLCPFTANYTAVRLTVVFPGRWRGFACDSFWFSIGLVMMLGCFGVLSPWALRNWVTLGELHFLAPNNSNLPGELVPYGFMAWEKTWLYRVRDCYLVPWKLNEESISVDDIPARAFDTPEEKQRVAMILEQYNNDLTLT